MEKTNSEQKLFSEHAEIMLEIRKKFQRTDEIEEVLKNTYCFRIGQMCYMKEHETKLAYDRKATPDDSSIVKTEKGLRKKSIVIIVSREIESGESWLACSTEPAEGPWITYTVLRINLDFKNNELFDSSKLIYSKTWATHSDVLIQAVEHDDLILYGKESM